MKRKIRIDDIYSFKGKAYKVDEVSTPSIFAYDSKGNLKEFDKKEFTKKGAFKGIYKR